MRDYEIVYIFRSNFTPEEIEAKLERYHAILTEGSGEVTAVAPWGKRQLAYPIQKQTNAFYVVVQFTAEPGPLAELERVLKLDDDLLRYLVVLSEGELPVPESIPEHGPPAAGGGEAESGAVKKSDDDEDEDDEDEDEDEGEDEDEDEGDEDEDEDDEDEDEDEGDEDGGSADAEDEDEEEPGDAEEKEE